MICAESLPSQPVLLLLKHLLDAGVVTTTQLSKGFLRMARAAVAGRSSAQVRKDNLTRARQPNGYRCGLL